MLSLHRSVISLHVLSSAIYICYFTLASRSCCVDLVLSVVAHGVTVVRKDNLGSCIREYTNFLQRKLNETAWLLVYIEKWFSRVFSEPTALTSLKYLLEMQILIPKPGLIDSRGGAHKSVLKSPQDDSNAH